MVEADFSMSREEMKVYQLELIQKLIEEKGGLCKTGDILSLGVDYRRLNQFLAEGQVGILLQ